MFCDFVGSTARRWYRGYKEVVIAVNAGRGEEVDPGAAERRLSYGEFESLPSASESCPTSQQISPASVRNQPPRATSARMRSSAISSL